MHRAEKARVASDDNRQCAELVSDWKEPQRSRAGPIAGSGSAVEIDREKDLSCSVGGGKGPPRPVLTLLLPQLLDGPDRVDTSLLHIRHLHALRVADHLVCVLQMEVDMHC
jgi:hypothetical protein